MTPIKQILAAGAVALTFSLPAPAVEEPPAGGEPRDFTLPAIERETLDNGLKTTMVEFGTVPKVTITAVVRVGNLNEADNTWLADITGEMIKEGTDERSAKDIAIDAAKMGGGLEISVGPDETTLSIDVLSEFAPDAVRLLADVLTSPSLPESELDRIRQNFLRNLAVARTQPRSQASEAFSQLIYGDHPYGRAFPTEAQLTGYTIDDVRSFYTDNFGAARTHLYVGGQFDRGAVEAAIAEAFGDWQEGPAPLDNPPSPAKGLKVKLIDRPDAPQSTLYLGLPAVGPQGEDYVAFQVANTLLGGYFSSRITANIREDKGYTYSPRSRITNRLGASHWVQVADVTTEHTGASLKEIFYEIDRLRDAVPSDSELEGVKNYRSGIYVLANASRGGLLSQLAFLDLHGLDQSYLTDYVANVFALTPQDLSDVTRRYLDNGQMTLVVVGDLDQITGQLEALPQLEGVTFDVAEAEAEAAE